VQIKRFEAQDMTEALRMIKKEFGPDAVILSARSKKKRRAIFGSLKKPAVEVTAAKDTNYPTTRINTTSFAGKNGQSVQFDQSDLAELYRKRKLINHPNQANVTTISRNRSHFPSLEKSMQNGSEGLHMVKHQMLSQGISEDIVLQLIREMKRRLSNLKELNIDNIKICMKQIIEETCITNNLKKTGHKKNKIMAFIGPTGVGKTTTIAKLAAFYSVKKNKQVGLLTLDNYRIAAVAQLEIYAKIIGLPLSVAKNSIEIEDSLQAFEDKDLVFIDTAGISPRNQSQIFELENLLNNIHPAEIHLLLSATTKEIDLSKILESFKAIRYNRLLFTKLDESAAHGNIFNQVMRSKIPISYFTDGQNIPENIEEATPQKLLDLILEPEKTMNPISTLTTGTSEVKRNQTTPNLYYQEFYVANRNSVFFHYPDCERAEQIKTRNMIVFSSYFEALDRNYKPCHFCDPQDNVDQNSNSEIARVKSSGVYR
jgi:flagellar biosynthesis protein FlhF